MLVSRVIAPSGPSLIDVVEDGNLAGLGAPEPWKSVWDLGVVWAAGQHRGEGFHRRHGPHQVNNAVAVGAKDGEVLQPGLGAFVEVSQGLAMVDLAKVLGKRVVELSEVEVARLTCQPARLRP